MPFYIDGNGELCCGTILNLEGSFGLLA